MEERYVMFFKCAQLRNRGFSVDRIAEIFKVSREKILKIFEYVKESDEEYYRRLISE